MVRFDIFMEDALYGPGGFFTSGHGAGRRGDFLTSPEVGPLFGAVVARAVDAEWAQLGRPRIFTVVEAGAGRGALARAVLAARPACAGALRYVCVERSAALRRQAADVAGVTVAEDLPSRITGMVLANELLDNLAFRLLERRTKGWAEIFVGPAGDSEFEEVLVDAPPDAAECADHLAPHAEPGARLPLQQQASAWVAAALDCLERGRLVVVDYAATTPSLVRRPWQEWVRTHRRHVVGGAPWEQPGSQDVTCEVAVDQLASVRPPDHDRSQAEWLRAHGIDDLVASARATWHQRAHLGDLTALTARSRVGEAEALCDPAGLGAFRVLEWLTPASLTPRSGGGNEAGAVPLLPPERGEGRRRRP